MYGFMLVVDEAHATLVCGVNGGGICEQEQVGDMVIPSFLCTCVVVPKAIVIQLSIKKVTHHSQ